MFTDRPLAGNPLAVVPDADGLDGERMQAIGRFEDADAIGVWCEHGAELALRFFGPRIAPVVTTG